MGVEYNHLEGGVTTWNVQNREYMGTTNAKSNEVAKKGTIQGKR